MKTARGFTLVEMIVSVGIFAMVMLAATSAYLGLISLDRQARATNQVVNNLSFAVDAMARGIRTGTNYRCIDPAGSPDGNGNSTNGGCTCFSYTDTNLAQSVTYHREANGTIGRAIGVSSCLDNLSEPITDPSINIASNGLIFYVRGAGNSNDQQPQVLFTLKGSMVAAGSGTTTTFTLEESATQRLIDL
jgi:prepilin-type N-terminal cleavage/methylation domain-containing protein